MQDLVAGQIDLTITSPATSMAQVRAGLIKGYAITANSLFNVVSHDPPVVMIAVLPHPDRRLGGTGQVREELINVPLESIRPRPLT